MSRGVPELVAGALITAAAVALGWTLGMPGGFIGTPIGAAGGVLMGRGLIKWDAS